MRKITLAATAAAAFALATPAMAYDSGGYGSMQRALDVANSIGLTTIQHTQFEGDKWQIEGRDWSGRYMEVYVDANTDQVLYVNR